MGNQFTINELKENLINSFEDINFKNAFSLWISSSPENLGGLELEKFLELMLVSCEKGIEIPIGKIEEKKIFNETTADKYSEIIYYIKVFYNLMIKNGYSIR